MIGVLALFFSLAIAQEKFGAIDLIEIAMSTGDLDRTVAQVPELIRHNALLFPGSQSAQHSDWEFPRAILFDGPFRMAFGGGRHTRGRRSLDSDGDTIELIQFDLSRRKYDFYEISFANGKAHLDPAPTSCKDCHSRFLRPTWLSVLHAPQWAGGMGSTQSIRTEDWITGKEAALFRAWLLGGAKHPRYQALGLERLGTLTDDGLNREFTGRNLRFENELAKEMPHFFLGELQRQKQLHLLRPALLKFLEGSPAATPALLTRAESLRQIHWKITQDRERLRDRVLGFDREELPPENTLPAENLLGLAAIEQIIADSGVEDLWAALSTSKFSDQFEIPGGLSPEGLLGHLRGVLINSAIEEHALYEVLVDGTPSDILNAIIEADNKIACGDLLKP